MATDNHQDNIEASRAPLVTHLTELKKRLIWCLLAFAIAAGTSYYFAEEIYSFLVKPLAEAENGTNRRMIYTSLAEAFVTYIKLAAFSGFIFSFPVIAWQLYSFISPGLYKNEKCVVLPYLFASPILFTIGAALAYYGVFPVAWKFFLSFEMPLGETGIPIQLEARVSEYLGIVTQLVIGFGLAFQLPVILALMTHAGFIGATTLKNKRKLAIVLIFVAAAFLTPPDILSQICLALPLMLLYELSVLWCSAIEKGRPPEQQEDDEEHLMIENMSHARPEMD